MKTVSSMSCDLSCKPPKGTYSDRPAVNPSSAREYSTSNEPLAHALGTYEKQYFLVMPEFSRQPHTNQQIECMFRPPDCCGIALPTLDSWTRHFEERHASTEGQFAWEPCDQADHILNVAFLSISLQRSDIELFFQADDTEEVNWEEEMTTTQSLPESVFSVGSQPRPIPCGPTPKTHFRLRPTPGAQSHWLFPQSQVSRQRLFNSKSYNRTF